MSMVTPPPQAYTRDVIAQAFEWLQSQPSHIRELASNTDGMVSLFLQAKRRGGSLSFPGTQAPSSAESFKQDLKNLAEGLRQFEGTKTAPSVPVNTYQEQPPIKPTPTPVAQTLGTTSAAAPQQAVPLSTPNPAQAAPVQQVLQAPQAPIPPTAHLDPRTQQILIQVRNRLNLSSESEALRMLIVLGSERLSDSLPKN
jgi:hypothetical protein